MTEARRTVLCLLLLVLAPALLLSPSLFFGRTFVPFDIAQYPPVATMLTAEQLAEVKSDQNTDVTEIPLVFEPELRFTRAELQAGRLPEWNPYARSGAPLLATAVVGLLYPPNWILLCFAQPADGFAWLAWFSYAVAAIGTFGLLRCLGLGREAAMSGAVLFAFSSTLAANAHFYQRLGTLIWLPVVLWALLRIAWSPRFSPSAFTGMVLALAMMWLAGFPAYAAACTLVVGLVASVLLGQRFAAGGRVAARRMLLVLVAALLAGLLLASVQLLPMFAFFPESNRTPTPGPADLAAQTFDPSGLLGYLLPSPFGHPHLTTVLPYGESPLAAWLSTRTDWEHGRPLLPNYNFVEYSVYPGVLALLLIVMAGVGLRRTTPAGARPVLATAWMVALILLLLATAPPLVRWISGLPGIANVPPLRFLGPMALVVATLAALGLDRLCRAPASGRCMAAMAFMLFLASAGLWGLVSMRSPEQLLAEILPSLHRHYVAYNPQLTPEAIASLLAPRMAPAVELLSSNLRGATFLFLAATVWCVLLLRLPAAHVPWVRRLGLILAAVELLALAHAVHPGRHLKHAHRTPIHDFLVEQHSAAGAQGGFTVARARAADASPMPLQLPPCTLVPERIRDLNIYTFVDGRSHLPLARLFGEGNMLREFWSGALPDDDRLRHPYLDLLGVRYLLSTTRLQHAEGPVGPPWRGPGGEFFIYERPDALPRMFVVDRQRVLADDQAVVEALVDPDLQPRLAALVVRDDAGSISGSPSEQADATPLEPRAVTVQVDTPIHVVADVGPGSGRYLVCNDTYMTGWTATVDGRPTPIIRANLFMRLVELPETACRVEFRYRTPRLVVGILVSLLTAIALLAVTIVARSPQVAE